MQLYVTYTIGKASLTKIIVLHDVTSRVMVQSDSLRQLTAEARFGAKDRPCRNCWFSPVPQFSFVSVIPHMLHIHSFIIDAL
jgi:hypothetical protein